MFLQSHFFLDSQQQRLILNAIEVRKFAYQPYSNFAVGACLETEDGSLYTGCNVENAVLGLTICAERTAVVKAITEGKKVFKRIAVIGAQENSFTTPCGSCRQFLSEFNPDLQIYVTRPDLGKVFVSTVRLLLPFMFDGGDLKD